MKEEYTLEIVTDQFTDGEREQITMNTTANITGTADDYSITYTDNDGDLKGCVTTLHVLNSRKISITRRGEYNSHIIIEKNVRHLSHHITPYMSFTMGISCLSVDSDFENGTLSFRYATDIEMVPAGEIEFSFKFA